MIDNNRISAFIPRVTGFLLILLSACSFSGSNPVLGGDPNSPNVILITNSSGGTLTPTPFQPLPITPTFNPDGGQLPNLGISEQQGNTNFFATLSPTWGNYPPPSIYPSTAVPPPMQIFNLPKNQISILLMGSDQRPYDPSYRTDILILAVINFDKNTINLLSIPRDLFVYVPGFTMQRINTTQLFGGFNLTALTFEYNFGVKPDHWGIINFDGFTALINILGGVNVQVFQTLTDNRAGYGQYTVLPGTVKMDGDTALWYVRSRYTTSDFDRNRRQQELIIAIFNRLLSLDVVAKGPELYNQFNQTVQTDMSLVDILPILPFAPRFAEPNRINNFAVGPAHVIPWTIPSTGAEVLLPNRADIFNIMIQVLNLQ